MIKNLFIILAVVIVLILGGIAVKVIFFPVKVVQNMAETAYDATDKVLNADNAIYNYEWFKQAYENIQATKIKVKNAENALNSFVEFCGDRSTWTFEDKTEYSRLSSVVLGLKNHYEQLVADYNARSKMATRNIFEDSVLPSFIDALTFLKD